MQMVRKFTNLLNLNKFLMLFLRRIMILIDGGMFDTPLRFLDHISMLI